MKHILFICYLGISITSSALFAGDDAQEKYWSGILTERIDSEQVVWLETGQQKFLSLYLPDVTGRQQGAAIIMHSLGTNPDWPQVTAPLRNSLPRYGWASLSVQLPVLSGNTALEDYGPLFDEIPPRLQAAITFLRAKGIQNIVLIGHDLGAAMAAAFLAQNTSTDITAFIGISMPGYKMADSRMYTPNSIKSISLPILDVYGSRDLHYVIESKTARTDAARSAGFIATRNQTLDPFRQSATAQEGVSKKNGYIAYRQIEIAGADHNYNGSGEMLNKRIIGWLKKHAGGIVLSNNASR